MLLVYLTLGIHIRLGLGHWPVPMIEDYRSPAFLVHEVVLLVWLYCALFGAMPLWLLCLLIRPLQPSRRVAVTQLLTFGVGWLLIAAVLIFDPTTLSAWFLD